MGGVELQGRASGGVGRGWVCKAAPPTPTPAPPGWCAVQALLFRPRGLQGPGTRKAACMQAGRQCRQCRHARLAPSPPLCLPHFFKLLGAPQEGRGGVVGAGLPCPPPCTQCSSSREASIIPALPARPTPPPPTVFGCWESIWGVGWGRGGVGEAVGGP